MESIGQLGRYALIDEVGAGTLGVVYRARDTRTGRTALVRRLPPELLGDAERSAALTSAAQTASSLSHPNVAMLYEFGREGAHAFLAQEFVPGDPLDRVLAGRPLHPRRALEITLDVVDALDAVHAAGLVHGDVRPGTIVVTPKGPAKLLDAGLSPFTAGGLARKVAVEQGGGEGAGWRATVPYLSPEQALGERVDHRTDLFSAGAVLYEMLTGRPAFGGEDAASALLAVARSIPLPPGRLNAAIPTALDAILDRALAKRVDARYENALSMARALRIVEAELGRGSDAAAVGMPARTGLRLSWWLVPLLVAVALSAIVWAL